MRACVCVCGALMYMYVLLSLTLYSGQEEMELLIEDVKEMKSELTEVKSLLMTIKFPASAQQLYTEPTSSSSSFVLAPPPQRSPTCRQLVRSSQELFETACMERSHHHHHSRLHYSHQCRLIKVLLYSQQHFSLLSLLPQLLKNLQKTSPQRSWLT